MWDIEVEGYEEDLMWVSRSGRVGVMKMYGGDVWDVIPYEIYSFIYRFPDRSSLVVFDENLYKLEPYTGNIYWVMERLEDDLFVGNRGFSSFEKAKREALEKERLMK